MPAAYLAWPEPDDTLPSAVVTPPSKSSTTFSPFIIYILLALVAVLIGSTGPTWFKLMGSDDPTLSGLVRANWRMQGTFLIQLPLAVYEISRAGWDRARMREWLWMCARLALPVGTALGLHFTCVATAVGSTSFSHAMSVINTAPLFFTGASLIRFALSKVVPQGGNPATPTPLAEEASEKVEAGGAPPPTPPPSPAQPPPSFLHPSRSPPPGALEVIGSVTAFLGIYFLVSDSASSDVPVTISGDIIGLGASLFMAVYLAGGKYREKWVGIFSWMCPLHFMAALTTGLLSLAMGASVDSLFAFWWKGGTTLGAVAGAVILPSLIAHSLINLLTVPGRLSPFIVSMILNLQPITGNIFGWAMGIQQQPSAFSLLCAPIIVLGTVLATVGAQGKSLKDLLGCFRAGH
jgi:drug/metabolite transporter (DMT)-like permease